MSPRVIRFYFDYESPNAYLAWTQLPKLAERHGCTIEPFAILYAGLLDAHGHVGPGEIPAKGRWMWKNLLRKAAVVGNPGCYPTAALLAIIPLLQSGVGSARGLIIDAKSGVSGAGRGATLGTHFSEVNENVKPYSVAAHRHTPEIEQELAAQLGTAVAMTFTPHLIPMTRGILVTAYLPLAGALTTDEATAILREAYAGEPFVRVLDGELPQTKATTGSNFCDVAARVDGRNGMVIAMAALDNLVKGASGQAIQNMNVMFGFPETMGLRAPGLYP
jgi:N-acetyl-gamma-glutamyl-phosphate reductase